MITLARMADLTHRQRVVLTALGNADGPEPISWLLAEADRVDGTGLRHTQHNIAPSLGSFFRHGLAARHLGHKNRYVITTKGRQVLAAPVLDSHRPAAGGDGGYASVAAVLNEAFAWPDGKVIDRRQVERWHSRRTRNQLGQLPPSPTLKRRGVPRTAPKIIWEDPGAWVEWARPGVPGLRGQGWTVPAERELAGAVR